jgi:tripartite-type tricarboxylate transporter receptor subunit TctC
VKELVDQARAQPGALSYGSIGIGSAQHLSMELLKVASGHRLSLPARRHLPSAAPPGVAPVTG